MTGKIFRQAWIDGVNRHFPGEPKSGYVAPWENMPPWEQDSASNVFDHVRLLVTSGDTSRLTREQKSRFVALCWLTQVYKHTPDPKPSYVADWPDLPTWQQETDADIFEAIERL